MNDKLYFSDYVGTLIIVFFLVFTESVLIEFMLVQCVCYRKYSPHKTS